MSRSSRRAFRGVAATREAPVRSQLSAWLWFTFSLAPTIITDIFVVASQDQWPFAVDFTNSFLYLIPQSTIFFAIALARGDAGRWANVLADGVPLMAGAFLTWLATVLVWPFLESCYDGETGEAASCDGILVNQEYFAQVSQLLPILLIALVVELRFFQSEQLSGPRSVRAATVITIIAAGEIAAILALPRIDNTNPDWLLTWAEYGAFLTTINAVAVALTALIWGCADPAGRNNRPRRRRATECLAARNTDRLLNSTMSDLPAWKPHLSLATDPTYATLQHVGATERTPCLRLSTRPAP